MLTFILSEFFSHTLISNLFRYITFRALIAALISFLIVFFLTPKFIKLLERIRMKQIVRDDGPKSHLKKTGTPTMGGVLMVIAVVLSSLLCARVEVSSVWISLFVFVGFATVGLVDDLLKFLKKNTKGVSFRAKMLSLGLISIIAVWWALMEGIFEPSIHIPFIKDFKVSLETWMFFLWSYVVLVGSSNAVNLTDGLDGLAIVPVMTTSFVLLVMSYVVGHSVMAQYLQFLPVIGAGELAVVMAAVIGAGLGFLWYNAHPAQIFMGDVGSLSLGGLLGIVAILTHKELVLFIAGFLFVIEAVSVMIQVLVYKRTKKRIFKMAPIHHHFELSGWAESKVIVRFWILSILFAIVALTTLKLR